MQHTWSTLVISSHGERQHPMESFCNTGSVFPLPPNMDMSSSESHIFGNNGMSSLHSESMSASALSLSQSPVKADFPSPRCQQGNRSYRALSRTPARVKTYG